MELLNVDTLEEAREKLLKSSEKITMKTEYVYISHATGRVLAENITATSAVPGFRKSTIDGYAVKARDTQGITDSIPGFFQITGEVKIGTPAVKRLKSGECMYVPTGGMIPDGADAVVMIEYAENLTNEQVALYDSVSPGRNIISEGEDIKKGEILLKAGKLIRPQESGALAACGYANVKVFAKPTITIISTGNELVDITTEPAAGQIRDINTYTIEAQCRTAGIEVVKKAVLKDEEALLKRMIKKTMEYSDIVVTSGGSSQGKQDFTADVIDSISSPGVFTHGIALKPGKPTIIAFDEKTETVLMGLPGHPAAAMIVFELLVMWLIRKKMGMSEKIKIIANMESNVAAGAGRATCQMVELRKTARGYSAKPILGKSGLITTLTRSYGYTIIEHNKEGLKEGEQVPVTPF